VLSVEQFLSEKQIWVLEHPPYSHDMAAYEFFHVPRIKNLPERVSCWIIWRHSRQCDDSTERTFRKWFPAILSDMAEMADIAEILERIYKVRMWVTTLPVI
jgi:hypothetical protein